jgi:GGDEF domain-containing protein
VKLQAAFAVPQLIDGQDIPLTLSIGISVYPDDGDDVDTLMHNADTAMYQAKAGGRNDYRFFRPDMGGHAVKRPFVGVKASRMSKQA